MYKNNSLYVDEISQELIEAANEIFNETQAQYLLFCQDALERFGVRHYSHLGDQQRKDYHNYIDRNFKGTYEQNTDLDGSVAVTYGYDKNLSNKEPKFYPDAQEEYIEDEE